MSTAWNCTERGTTVIIGGNITIQNKRMGKDTFTRSKITCHTKPMLAEEASDFAANLVNAIEIADDIDREYYGTIE